MKDNDYQFTASNLHAGNILSYDTGEGIYFATIDWQDLKWLDEDSKDFHKTHKPVALSVPLLELIGFSSKEYKEGYIGIDVKIENCRTDFPLRIADNPFTFEYRIGSLPFFNELNYLHELQNLFRVIPGGELILPKKYFNIAIKDIQELWNNK